MRRASTFTRAIFPLTVIGWVVGGAASQTPASAPANSQLTTQPAADTLCARGRACRLAGDLDAAIEFLTRAVRQSPDDLGCVSELARAQALRQDWPAVRKLLAPVQDKLDPDLLVLLADACTRTGQARHAANVLERGLRRRPESEVLWLALLDRALESGRCASVLERIGEAREHLGPTPQLLFREAQAYYRLGQVLGRTRVIRVPGGRAGQFVDNRLLVREHGEPDRFLCCPPESALYALRRALDAGLDEPAAHLLHARIWQRAGQPEIALAILQGREALWLEDASAETLATFAEVALAADALDGFLRYARLHAAREPQRRDEILFDALTAAAERYNQRGDLTMSRELLRRAAALRPDDVPTLLRLADAVYDGGDQAEAATWYRRVLEHEPNHPQRRRILRRLAE